MSIDIDLRERRNDIIRAHVCPYCHAKSGRDCTTQSGARYSHEFHKDREALYGTPLPEGVVAQSKLEEINASLQVAIEDVRRHYLRDALSTWVEAGLVSNDLADRLFDFVAGGEEE